MTTTTMLHGDAARLTQRIELRLSTIADNTEAVILMIEEARNGNAHEVLGYRSWTEYVSENFGGALTRLSKAERLPFIGQMTDQGMSTRAIGEVVGVSKDTVSRDLRTGVSSETPTSSATKTTGVDGKTYTRSEPKPPRRRPLPDQYRTALWELDKAVTRIEKLQSDDRFDPASDAYRTGHLTMLLKRLTATVDPHVVALEESSGKHFSEYPFTCGLDHCWHSPVHSRRLGGGTADPAVGDPR